MKKTWVLFLWLLCFLLPINIFAICAPWVEECNDIWDSKYPPTDDDVKFLLQMKYIKATDDELGKYWLEWIKSYFWSYKNWITSKETFKEADFEWVLTRIAMAKMLSNYAIYVLLKKPANIIVPNFSDVSNDLDDAYDNWVSLAYQLWIMWIWIDEFRPFDSVTRAEFATALSRLLYWTVDGNPYYVTHLATLKDEWIINNDDFKILETRWYLMLMLMRATKIVLDS